MWLWIIWFKNVIFSAGWPEWWKDRRSLHSELHSFRCRWYRNSEHLEAWSSGGRCKNGRVAVIYLWRVMCRTALGCHVWTTLIHELDTSTPSSSFGYSCCIQIRHLSLEDYSHSLTKLRSGKNYRLSYWPWLSEYAMTANYNIEQTTHSWTAQFIVWTIRLCHGRSLQRRRVAFFSCICT